MPQLKDTRRKIEATIPSIEGSKIVLRDGLLASAVEEIDGLSIKSDFQRGLLMLEKMIESWNLTDEENKPAEINVDNLRKLNMSDIDYLLSQTEIGKRADVKKNEIAGTRRTS